jgi:hypothetical protein
MIVGQKMAIGNVPVFSLMNATVIAQPVTLAARAGIQAIVSAIALGVRKERQGISNAKR